MNRTDIPAGLQARAENRQEETHSPRLLTNSVLAFAAISVGWATFKDVAASACDADLRNSVAPLVEKGPHSAHIQSEVTHDVDLLAEVQAIKATLGQYRKDWESAIGPHFTRELDAHKAKYGPFSGPHLTVTTNTQIPFVPFEQTYGSTVTKDAAFADRLFQLGMRSLELRTDLYYAEKFGVINDPERYIGVLSTAITALPDWRAFVEYQRVTNPQLTQSAAVALAIASLVESELQNFGNAPLIGPLLSARSQEPDSIRWQCGDKSILVSGSASVKEVALDIISNLAPNIATHHPTFKFQPESESEQDHHRMASDDGWHDFLDDHIFVGSGSPANQVTIACHELGHAISRTAEIALVHSIATHERALSLIASCEARCDSLENRILNSSEEFPEKERELLVQELQQIRDEIKTAEPSPYILEELKHLEEQADTLEEAAAIIFEEIARQKIFEANPEQLLAFSREGPLSGDGNLLLEMPSHWKGRWIAAELLRAHGNDLAATAQFLCALRTIQDIYSFKDICRQAEHEYQKFRPLARPEARNFHEQAVLLLEDWNTAVKERRAALKIEWDQRKDDPQFHQEVIARMQRTEAELAEQIRPGMELR